MKSTREKSINLLKEERKLILLQIQKEHKEFFYHYIISYNINDYFIFSRFNKI